MFNLKYCILSLLFLFTFLAVPTKASTSSSHPLLKIFYYREGKNALASLFAHPKKIDVLAPQSYSIDENGDFSGKISDEVLEFCSKNNIKIMPLITNKGFNSNSGHYFLDNMSEQETALSEMVAEAKSKKYWGYQIDFEQIDAGYKDAFSAFVKRFSEKMKNEGLVASVAVVAKISDNKEDYKNSLWQNLIGVYDYDALGKSADFVSIMSYDDPTSKGPIAGWQWLLKVLDYSILHIPKEKISLGVGFYYWAWDNVHEKIQGIGGYEFMQKVLKKYKTTYTWSKEEHAPYLVYHKGKVQYKMWYENGKSLKDKIGLIKKYNLHGFSAWALGLEVPSIYNVL